MNKMRGKYSKVWDFFKSFFFLNFKLKGKPVKLYFKFTAASVQYDFNNPKED